MWIIRRGGFLERLARPLAASMPHRLTSSQFDRLNALRPEGIIQRVEIARTTLCAALATCQPTRCSKCCAVITADRSASRETRVRRLLLLVARFRRTPTCLRAEVRIVPFDHKTMLCGSHVLCICTSRDSTPGFTNDK